MKQRRPNPVRQSRGFTLIELLLVLAILVAATVLTWPRMVNSLARAEHRAAAEQVQSTLWQLRLEAIQTGCPQWFRYRPGTSEYEVAALPYDEVDSIDFAGPSVSAREPQGLELDPEGYPSIEKLGPDGAEREHQKLENNIVFLGPDDMQTMDVANGRRAPEEIVLASGGELSLEEDAIVDSESAIPSTESQWPEPIVFYPDGRVDDARIVVRAPSGDTLEITVSGMAGHVRIGPRQKPPRDLPDVLETVPTDEVEWEP